MCALAWCHLINGDFNISEDPKKKKRKKRKNSLKFKS